MCPKQSLGQVRLPRVGHGGVVQVGWLAQPALRYPQLAPDVLFVELCLKRTLVVGKVALGRIRGGGGVRALKWCGYSTVAGSHSWDWPQTPSTGQIQSAVNLNSQPHPPPPSQSQLCVRGFALGCSFCSSQRFLANHSPFMLTPFPFQMGAPVHHLHQPPSQLLSGL